MTDKTTILTYKSRSGPLELKEIPLREPNANEVLVKVEYAAINPVDIKLKALAYMGPAPILREYSGVVEKVGSALAGKYTVGEKVSGHLNPSAKHGAGTYYLAEPADGKDVVVPSPKRLSGPEAGSYLLTFGTAFQLLQTAKLSPESEVLILGGATTVGTFAIQLAKLHYKVKRVVTTASPRSFDYVKQYGADEVIDYHSADFRKELVASASPAKYQTIIDCVGGYDAIAVSNKLLRPVSAGSNYATVFGDASPGTTYGTTMGKALLTLPRMAFRMLFGKYYGLKYNFLFVNNKGNWPQFSVDFFNNTDAKVPIDSVYPLADFKKAWDRLDSTQARGKVVLDFTSN